jgi:hypothetical protein
VVRIERKETNKEYVAGRTDGLGIVSWRNCGRGGATRCRYADGSDVNLV